MGSRRVKRRRGRVVHQTELTILLEILAWTLLVVGLWMLYGRFALVPV